METTYLRSKAISSASNRRKKFSSLSSILFELSDFEESATEKKPKDKVIKISKFLTLYFLKTVFFVFFNGFLIFKLNDRLRHLLFCLILGKEFSKVNISKTACPNLKIFNVS